jgi:hypothetical protein
MAKAVASKVRMSRRLSKKKAAVVVDALPLFDVVPLSIVGYAQVNADGTLDIAKASRSVRVWRISKGYYNVVFDTDLMVRSVHVQLLRKSRSPRVIATVCPLLRHRVPDNMNEVEISLLTLRGAFVDCPFALIGVTDGSPVSQKPPSALLEQLLRGSVSRARRKKSSRRHDK